MITLLTQKSQANNFALKCFAEILTWLLVSFLFQPQTGFHVPYKGHYAQQRENACYKFAQIQHTLANMTTNLQQSI